MYQELENKALELLEENVNYDEAELGCNWGMEELKDFLKSHLKEAYKAGQEEGLNLRKAYNDPELLNQIKQQTLKQIEEWADKELVAPVGDVKLLHYEDLKKFINTL